MMHKSFSRLFIAAPLALVAACTAPASSDTVSVGQDPIRPLFGQWVVRSIAGQTPQPHDMMLLFGDDWWQSQSQCVWDWGDFEVSAGRLDFAPIERRFPQLAPGDEPLIAMCARGLSETESLVPQVLDGERGWAIEDGRLTISSSAGDLVAERLAGAVANPFGYSSVEPATTWGEWRVASVDGRAQRDAALVFANQRITLRLGCAYYQWLRGESAGLSGTAIRREPFARGCAHEPDEAERVLVAVVEEAHIIAADGADARILRGGAGTVRLSR